MNRDLTKTLIIAILMVALAFLVGSMAAGGRIKDALMPISAIVGAFTFLYLGRKAWWLIFIVPAIQSFLPISRVFGLPISQLVTAAVFAYWLLMWIMGYVSIKWRSLVWLDVPVMLYFLYFALTYTWNPVSIGVLGEDADMIGGKDYIFLALAFVTYCALSLIPCVISQLVTIVKWSIGLSVFMSFFNVFKGSVRMGASGIAEGAMGGRFGLFSGLGSILTHIICAWYKPWRIILSPWRLLGLVIAVFMVAMGGWRERMLALGVYISFCAFCFRQLHAWILVGIVALSGIYLLNEQEFWLDMPHGVQRVMTPLPGLKLDKDIVSGATHSTEWRKVMWNWAFDTRLGYIKDYVWGDGFGVSRTLIKQNTVNINRGRVNYGEQDFFAETGTWHSGFISTIHRLGCVGLFFEICFHLAAFIVILRLCTALEGKKERPYAMYMLIPYIGGVVQFYISAGTFAELFIHVSTVALAKVFYVECLKEGLIPPMFSRKIYVPLMIQEEERKRLRQARQELPTVAAKSA